MREPARLEGVVVVGGGYAGPHAVRAVERLGIGVTVIERSGDHDVVTRPTGGSGPEHDARRPRGRLARRAEVGSVVAVGDGAVELVGGRHIEADGVVVTASAAAETASDQSAVVLLTQRPQVHEKTACIPRSMLA